MCLYARGVRATLEGRGTGVELRAHIRSAVQIDLPIIDSAREKLAVRQISAARTRR